MQIWIYQIKISWIKKFINCWLALKRKLEKFHVTGFLRAIGSCIIFVSSKYLTLPFTERRHLLAPPQRGCPWLYKLRLHPTITFHLILFSSKKISLCENYLVYLCAYLFIELRESRDHVCSHHCIPTPRGTRQVLSEYLPDIHLNAWICSTWICTTEL